MKVKVHVFWLRHFANSKIEFESSFPIKYYIITILKKIGAFLPIFNKVNKGFPIVFLNLARKGSRGFFQARKLIFFARWLVFTFLTAVWVPNVWILSSPFVVFPYVVQYL